MGLFSSSFLLMCVAFFGLTCAQVRFCVNQKMEMKKCATFSNMANITCVNGDDGMDCVNKIKNNEADITTLDGGDIYLAGKCHDIKPIISESTTDNDSGAKYYAVAVAKKNSIRTMKTLQGSKSCHTGVNKTAGWFVPMSVIFQSKANQLQQASSFFAESCAPGAKANSNMCKLCTPNCERNSNNDYYGYDGAAKCLNETDADVAFVKHSTFLSNPNKDQYKLLCKDGSTTSIDNYINCYLAKVPSHAIVAKKDMTYQEIDGVFATIDMIPRNILFSQDFGKNKIFSSSTNSLSKTYVSYTNYLGNDYINALPETVC